MRQARCIETKKTGKTDGIVFEYRWRNICKNCRAGDNVRYILEQMYPADFGILTIEGSCPTVVKVQDKVVMTIEVLRPTVLKVLDEALGITESEKDRRVQESPHKLIKVLKPGHWMLMLEAIRGQLEGRGSVIELEA